MFIYQNNMVYFLFQCIKSFIITQNTVANRHLPCTNLKTDFHVIICQLYHDCLLFLDFVIKCIHSLHLKVITY